jgi:hypothetical protein
LADGYAWAGVTAYRVTVEGQPPRRPGMPATTGLPVWDPERYGSLHHAGDEFSYEIFPHAAQTVAVDRPLDGVDPLGELQPRLFEYDSSQGNASERSMGVDRLVLEPEEWSVFNVTLIQLGRTAS